MKRPLLLLALLPLGVWAFFVFPDLLANTQGFWDWRRALIILSGILALWWMSAGMLLATRPAWLEKRFGGLDKLYRLHKDIGIGAGVLVFTHWMMEWLPKNLAKLGWIERGNRPRGPRGEPDMWIDLAKEVGEWAGYILLALVVIALVKRIPYRWFRLVHKAFGLIFIGGAFHGLMLMPKSFWSQPLGWLTAAVAAMGVIAALLSLSNRIGRQRQYPARIEAVRRHDGDLLEITCRPQSGWPGHKAGQFLFAHFGQAAEGAHPFTIASAWQPQDGTLTLAIKALGDYTAKLPELVKPGQTINLEGPYGQFDFVSRMGNGDDQPQVWIAGGIGVTPFLAKLGERAANPPAHADTDFFYCTPRASDFPDRLDLLCQQAGVRLHRRLTDQDGLLDPAEIQACLKPGCSVWFCGPAQWGKSLANKLIGQGLPDSAFHREAFEFR